MRFDNNPKRTVYSFDVDGVITNGDPFWVSDPIPNGETIEIIRKLYEAGNIIIIWTARQWECAPETVGWLIKNRVPFHGLYMAKGGSDIYIDDKAVTIEDFNNG